MRRGYLVFLMFAAIMVVLSLVVSRAQVGQHLENLTASTRIELAFTQSPRIEMKNRPDILLNLSSSMYSALDNPLGILRFPLGFDQRLPVLDRPIVTALALPFGNIFSRLDLEFSAVSAKTSGLTPIELTPLPRLYLGENPKRFEWILPRR